MKFNTEKNLRELEQRLITDRLNERQQANLMDDLSNETETINRISGYILQIIANKEATRSDDLNG